MLSTTKHYNKKVNAATYEGEWGGNPYRIRWTSVSTGYVNGVGFRLSWNPNLCNTYFLAGCEVELPIKESLLIDNAILQTRRDWYASSVKFTDKERTCGTSCNKSVEFRTKIDRIEMNFSGGWQSRSDKNHRVHRGIVEAQFA